MKAYDEMKGNFESLEERDRTLLKILTAILIMSYLIVFLIGALAAFAWGTSVQEQVLVDQIMIRDLNLSMCYIPQGSEGYYAGKPSVFSITDIKNPSDLEKYKNYTGHYPDPRKLT